MDFFNTYLSQAQAQAKVAALNAQKSAKGFAQQVQEHTKVIAEHVTENTKILAEQASTLSSAAAESAQHRLRSLDGLKAPLGSLGKPEEPDAPAPAELAMFGVTEELLDFVRSLTYSTFRDFPMETLPPPPPPTKAEGGAGSRDARYLTPWQQQHAMLVVRAAREVNELRYVLCPKRMSDAAFWQIYFALARKLLPPEAFDADFRLPASAAPGLSLTDLQAQLTRLSTSAKEWGVQTGATLRTVVGGAAAATGPAQHANSLAASRGIPLGGGPAEGASPGGAAAARPAQDEAELGKDQELEAYLRDVMHGDGKAPEEDDRGRDAGSSGRGSAGHAAASVDESYVDARAVGSEEEGEEDADDDDDDDDFEKYLHELSGSEQEGEAGHDRAGKGAGHKGEEDSGDELDLDEYMRVLADEDK